MILYHGSNVEIDEIDLNKCKKYKDFGQGFYCTSIKQQAEFMAIRTTKREKKGEPCVSEFELDEKIFEDEDIKIKKYSFHTKKALKYLKGVK